MVNLLFGLNNYGYGYGYDDYGSALEKLEWMGTSVKIAVVLAFVLTIIAFASLLPANKRKGLNGFALWLHDFLNFKVLFVEAILKFLYVFVTGTEVIFCVLNMFNKEFLRWLVIMVILLIATRITYELTMLTVILVTNVIQINNKLKGDAGNVDMFQRDIDLNKFVPKQAPMQGYGQNANQAYNQGMPQQPYPNQPQQAAPSQQTQVNTQQAAAQQAEPQAVQQQAYPKFCKTCGSPIDQSTGKCPNCNQ